ncbi:hypothetical protein HCH_00583 [Hahella chejuensis KCTC 2396]|uniref:Uncharacterized protein n=1 Tax=Hahella chejuensis (strain KCTC 2396) TaxID=349521 RepID=Q2SPD8_HAHCH|nr:hypothetical protein HCH_00583 [Hahella chejuensis KCTC 2396]
MANALKKNNTQGQDNNYVNKHITKNKLKTLCFARLGETFFSPSLELRLRDGLLPQGGLIINLF